LRADAGRGDIIICRDQSRLGRDAIEVTLVVRDLVRDRGCRLYDYVTGQEVQFANALDQATTLIQGTGHQMEFEAIRSRTREALRSRVLACVTSPTPRHAPAPRCCKPSAQPCSVIDPVAERATARRRPRGSTPERHPRVVPRPLS